MPQSPASATLKAHKSVETTLSNLPHLHNPVEATRTFYLDCNATTPVLPAAADVAQRVMQAQFGNPSSSHAAGGQAKALLDDARAVVEQVLGAGQGQVMFNSGATEGIQTSVLSGLCAIRERMGRGAACGHLLVVGATEHKAVSRSLKHWNAVLGLGLEVRVLPVDANGRHDLTLLAQWLPDVAMLCTMAANNETGVVSNLQGIETLLRLADTHREAPVLWLVDCVQALGKMPLNLAQRRIDYAPFSGHKLYAPKGVGMLYVREGAPYTPLVVGGGQEDGARGGTENMAGIAAFATVLKTLQEGHFFASHDSLLSYRDALEQTLCHAFPGVQFSAPLQFCLPTTLNFSVPGVSSQTLTDALEAVGIQVSAGSACSAASAAPSEVLQAMGLPPERCRSAVRLSIGPWVSSDFIENACQAIEACGRRLQEAHAQNQEPSLDLSWQDLASFLEQHPQACLVDVRDASEHLANPVKAPGKHPVNNAPLHLLIQQRPAWLQPDVPVVFVCRSGQRSLRAARWLQTQGHACVRHVPGGLASSDLQESIAAD